MRELLKKLVDIERGIEELREEKPNFYPYYSGYLKGLRDIKWILLNLENVRGTQMVNENIMTFEQNIEREQYLHFCKMNCFKPNKIESLITWGRLMRGVRHANSL